MKRKPVHISKIIESIILTNTHRTTMGKGIDESTRTNAFGGLNEEEYGYNSYFGAYKKLPKKSNQKEDTDREMKSSITFSATESYHDKDGKLKSRTVKY